MEASNPEIAKYVILSLWWLRFSWELLLNILQYRTYKTADVPVELDSVTNWQNFERLRSYKLAKLRCDFIEGLVSICLYTAIIREGLVAKTWTLAKSIASDAELPASCLWTFMVVTGFTLTAIPLNVYSSLLDIRYGSKYPMSVHMADKFLSYIAESWKLLFVAVLVPSYHWIGDSVFLILYITPQLGGLLFWIVLWSLLCRISTEAPPLRGQLKTEIEQAANTLEFPVTTITKLEPTDDGDDEIDALFTETNSSDHYIFCADGIISLDDHLFQAGCQHDEIVALVAHQIGHWKYRHLSLINTTTVLKMTQKNVACLIFYLLIHRPETYLAAGFAPSVQPLVPGMWILMEIVISAYNFLTKAVEQYFDRRMEYDADDFCVKMRRSEALKRAVLKLHRDDKEFPVNNRLYSFWYYYFPTLLERLKRLG